MPPHGVPALAGRPVRNGIDVCLRFVKTGKAAHSPNHQNGGRLRFVKTGKAAHSLDYQNGGRLRFHPKGPSSCGQFSRPAQFSRRAAIVNTTPHTSAGECGSRKK